MTLLQRRPEPAPPTAPAPAATGRHRLPALLLLAVLVLVGAAAALPLRTPEPQPASAPATRFSADRALTRIGAIAGVAHPSGSAAQARVRDLLVDEVRGLGLEPRVVTRVAARGPAGDATVGTVSDVHARIPGRDPTGRVLLVAHYDSVPTGPGASDDGVNVAGILEVARALLAGPRPRNDVDILFTDGEEQGLLGAQAFVDAGVVDDPQRTVVLNLEARGVSGPAVMFEMAGTGLAPAVRAADPVTTSVADQIYALLPNDTDLTVFADAGMRGLNFAFMDGAPRYHTAQDDVARIDRGSAQDMGDATLAAARQLAAADLAAPGGDATYFSLFGRVVSYPAGLVLPLAALAAAAYLWILLAGRRRGLAPRGVARAALTVAVPLVAAPAVGLGGWFLLATVRPDFAATGGVVQHPGRYALGEAAVVVVVLVAWHRWVRRRAAALDVAVGVLGVLALLALVCAVLAPAAAYLFTWPALAGSIATLVVLHGTAVGSPWRVVAGGATAVTATALLLPIALLLVPLLGLSLTAAALLLGALLVATAVGVLEPLPGRRALTAGMTALAVAGAGLVGVGAATDGYSADAPRPVSLGYLLEADTGTATWVGFGAPGAPLTGPMLDRPARLADRVPPLGGGDLRAGPAPVAPLVEPTAEEVAGQDAGGVRTAHVRIRAAADAHVVSVYADTTTHEVLGATVNGVALEGGRSATAPGQAWRWGFSYAAPPADGIDLRIRARGSGPVRLLVVSVRAGLPAGVGAPVLPANLTWASWPDVAGQTYVARTLTI